VKRDDGGRRLRVDAIADDPRAYIGRDLEVDIMEPIQGPTTNDERLHDYDRHYRVELRESQEGEKEGSDTEIRLVPAGYRVDDPKRRELMFDTVMTAPLRVRGRLVDESEDHSHPVVAIVVTQWWPLDLGAPIRVTSPAAVGPWLDRKLIELHGKYIQGFESSAVGPVWVYPVPAYLEASVPAASSPDVLVGVLFAKAGPRYGKRGRGYGHMGMYRAEILVSKLP
jgi:hypothetical protein